MGWTLFTVDPTRHMLPLEPKANGSSVWRLRRRHSIVKAALPAVIPSRVLGILPPAGQLGFVRPKVLEITVCQRTKILSQDQQLVAMTPGCKWLIIVSKHTVLILNRYYGTSFQAVVLGLDIVNTNIEASLSTFTGDFSWLSGWAGEKKHRVIFPLRPLKSQAACCTRRTMTPLILAGCKFILKMSGIGLSLSGGGIVAPTTAVSMEQKINA